MFSYKKSLLTIAFALFGCAGKTLTVASNQIYVVDGDTIKVHEVTYRLIGYPFSGVVTPCQAADTPETYRAKCPSEKHLGDQATARLRQMIGAVPTVTLEVEQGPDKYGRKLARLLVDARDTGRMLISEGLARPYFGGKRGGWC